MLVHRRSLPCNLLGFPNNSPVPIYTPGWREAPWELSVLPKNTTQRPLARAWTRTARSGDERTNHEATAPPTLKHKAKALAGNLSNLNILRGTKLPFTPKRCDEHPHSFCTGVPLPSNVETKRTDHRVLYLPAGVLTSFPFSAQERKQVFVHKWKSAHWVNLFIVFKISNWNTTQLLQQKFNSNHHTLAAYKIEIISNFMTSISDHTSLF